MTSRQQIIDFFYVDQMVKIHFTLVLNRLFCADFFVAPIRYSPGRQQCKHCSVCVTRPSLAMTMGMGYWGPWGRWEGLSAYASGWGYLQTVFFSEVVGCPCKVKGKQWQGTSTQRKSCHMVPGKLTFLGVCFYRSLSSPFQACGSLQEGGRWMGKPCRFVQVEVGEHDTSDQPMSKP